MVNNSDVCKVLLNETIQYMDYYEKTRDIFYLDLARQNLRAAERGNACIDSKLNRLINLYRICEL